MSKPLQTEIRPSDIKTSTRRPDWQYAEVTLADGRVFSIWGNRYRSGPRGGRSYSWSFTLHGPGIAHAERSELREASLDADVVRGERLKAVYLDRVRSYCSTMTGAKKRLASLIASL